MVNRPHILISLFLLISAILFEGRCVDLRAEQSLRETSHTDESLHDFSSVVPGEILVTFRSDATPGQVQAMIKAQGMSIIEMNEVLDLHRMSVSGPVRDAITAIQAYPFVETVRPNYVLAEAADAIITLLDLESAIHETPSFLRHVYARAEARETLLRTLVDYKLFARAAREEKLDELPEVERKIESTVERALAEIFLSRIINAVSVSEDKLQDYYETHLKEFQTPEQIKIRQIVVETEEEAREILEAVRAGEEFEKVARERSIGATAKSGGELGWFGRGRLDPAIEKEGFALEKGELSGIIETPSGFCVLRLEDKRSARQKSFLEVRNRIRQTLQEQRRKETVERRREGLEQKYGVRFHLESLSEIKVHTTGEVGQNALIRAFEEILEKHY